MGKMEILFAVAAIFLIAEQSEGSLWESLRGYRVPGMDLTSTSSTTTPTTPTAATNATTESTAATNATTDSTSATNATTDSTADTAVTVPTTAAPNVTEPDADAAGLVLFNYYRSVHHVPALTTDPDLKSQAAACAEAYTADANIATINATAPSTVSMASPCTNTSGANELLFLADPTSIVGGYALAAVGWEAEPYNFTNPDPDTLLYCEGRTQMLWKASTSCGCACSTTSIDVGGTNKSLCSCLFNPPGNQRTGFSLAGLQPYTQNVLAA